MTDPISSVEVFVVTLEQDRPYLGNLREGERVNRSGYFVRKGNRTVYPRINRSLVVRVRTRDGVQGWGETYGIITPQATAAIINDLLIDFVVGREASERVALHDELYDLMRVRGYTGGFYLDALAAVDIALWDIAGQQAGVSLSELLGGRCRDRIPAYVSGLPEDTLEARCDLAERWIGRGFDAVKFAAPVADEGLAVEFRRLRDRLGDEVQIAVDMHWANSADEAIRLAKEMAPHRPWFLEAPVETENVAGLARVAHESDQTIAAGEEWRTLHEAALRFDQQAVHIVQPEMGHTGITEFMRIGRRAESLGLTLIPHATIGSGIFLAASLHAAAALGNVASHEFQHSIFEPFRHFTGDTLCCTHGSYSIPDSPGLGVRPSEAMKQNMERIA